MNIFISYNWNNKTEADYVEKNLSSIGISIRRDLKDIKYKDDLREFMRQIRDSDYAIILISTDYLKSPNCLYELSELFKDRDFDKKILPVICDETKIYSIKDKVEIIKYWSDKCIETEESIKVLEPTNSLNLLKELKVYKDIYSSVDEFIDNITKRLNVKFSDAIKNNFEDILMFIGYNQDSLQNEIIRIRNIDNTQLKEIELEKLLRCYPNNKDIIFALGYLNLTESKNNLKAKNYYKEYVEMYNDKSYIAFNNLGLACHNLNEIELSEKYYYKGLELNPDSFEIFHNLGNLEAKKKNYKKAIEFFEKTIGLYPKDAETYYNIAKIYTDFEDNFELGKQNYNRAIELEPDFFMAYNNLASIYLREKNFDKAVKTLELGLEQNPNDPVTLYNLATLITIHLKDFSRAKKYFRESIRLNNFYISAKLGLAKLLILNYGDIDEAKELLLDAIKIEPNNEEILVHLSIVYKLLGELEKAHEYYDKASEINPRLKR
ncbi:tetratricopeptide repeat protein [Empedobacter brevis]|uniref:tetratricopeptide repeat protein n=1 Tax=Empedobacter brevis TaxID=247 RepID=UPI00123DBC05|nr:tetratricopeptide repeat protein [Empedobacter brevis]QES92863.1 tetratricopeptide repeat protein [Empedobacter brevis]